MRFDYKVLCLLAAALFAAQVSAQENAPMQITAQDFINARQTPPPSFDPAVFVACVDHPYFPLIPGTVYHYEEQTEDGVETVTVTVTNQTRDIQGVQATIVHDTVELDGEVTEDTWDWFGQDNQGNVWYLGEDTKEYEAGQVSSTTGSWEAGVDGAQPGIVMPAEPRPGDIYYQEFYPGEAEDMGAIASVSESVSVPFGAFEDVVMTADYNPLGSSPQLEQKYYARGIGVVQEGHVGSPESAVLLQITHDVSQMMPNRDCGDTDSVEYVGSLAVTASEDDNGVDNAAETDEGHEVEATAEAEDDDMDSEGESAEADDESEYDFTREGEDGDEGEEE